MKRIFTLVVTTLLVIGSGWMSAYAQSGALADGWYVVVAQRSTTSNYFYMTSEVINSRYNAVDAGTANKSAVATSGLEDKYVWEVVNNGTTIELKNYSGYFSWWNTGNTAGFDRSLSSHLTVTANSNGTFTLGVEDRYLSLNATAGNDFFAYYKTGQKNQLLFLPYTGEVQPMLSLDVHELTLNIGQQQTLTATFSDSWTGSSSLFWSSDNSEVAGVDRGRVTAYGFGTTKIRVRTRSSAGDYSDSCTVHVVPVPVTGFAFNQDTLIHRWQDQQMYLQGVITPSNATNHKVQYSFSRPGIASWERRDSARAENDLIVKSLQDDTVTLYGRTEDGGFVDSCKIVLGVRGIYLAEKDIALHTGEQKTLQVEFTPALAYDKRCTYTLSDETICSVDENGTITALKEGSTTLTITSVDDANKSIKDVKISVINADYVNVSETFARNASSFADIDGDGRLEALKVESYYAESDREMRAVWYNIEGEAVSTSSLGKIDASHLTHDFNNDGIPDLFFYKQTPKLMAYSTPSGYVVQDIKIDCAIMAELTAFGDFNRDGRADMFGYRELAPNNYVPFLCAQRADGTFVQEEFPIETDASKIKEAMYSTNGSGSFTVPTGVHFSGVALAKKPAHRLPSRRVAQSTNAVIPSMNGWQIVDMNLDGYCDLISEQGLSFISLPNGKYYQASIQGNVSLCDFNKDGIQDLVIFDTNTDEALLHLSKDNTLETSVLYKNEHITHIICQDMNHDDWADVLLLARANDYQYFLFFKNNGDGTFARVERFFVGNYTYFGIYDFNQNGYPTVVMKSNADGRVYKRIDWDSNFTLTESDFCTDIIEGENYYPELPYRDELRFAEYLGDGKLYMPLICVKYSSGGEYILTLYTPMHVTNTSPAVLNKPSVIVDNTTGLVKIEWQTGSDTETSTCDLDYEVMVRRNDTTYQQVLTTTAGSNSLIVGMDTWETGEYFAYVRAIDANGRKSTWSEGAAFTHTTPKAVFAVDKTTITTLDTITVTSLSGKTLQIEAQPDGRIVSHEGGIAKVVFADLGTKEIIAHYEGMMSMQQSVIVEPFRIIPTHSIPKEWNVFDLNSDGKIEGWDGSDGIYTIQNGEGTLNPSLNMTDVSIAKDALVIDKNRDGQPDFTGASNKKGNETYHFFVNNGYLDFSPENAPFTMPSTVVGDLDNNGCIDYIDLGDGENPMNIYENIQYTRLTTHTWSTFGNNTHAPTRVSSYQVRDLNKDGYLDLILVSSKPDIRLSILMNKGAFQFDIHQFPFDDGITLMEVRDCNSDGLLDVVYRKDVYYEEKRYKRTHYALEQNYDGSFAPEKQLMSLPLGFDFDNNGTDDFNEDAYIVLKRPDGDGRMYVESAIHYENSSGIVDVGRPKGVDDHWLHDWSLYRYAFDYDEDGYPEPKAGTSIEHLQSVYTNTAPTAPTTLYVNQTENQVVVSWEGASDQESSLTQLRYNISVRENGTKKYIYSPLNATSNTALTIYPGYEHYREATVLPMPLEDFTAGKTYEICVQTIDPWYAHSNFSQVVEFTPAAQLLIYLPTKGGVDVPVSYSCATNIESPTLSTDGGIVSGNTITWSTPGTKTVIATAAGITTTQTITIIEKPEVSIPLPEYVMEQTQMVVDLPNYDGVPVITSSDCVCTVQNNKLVAELSSLPEGQTTAELVFTVTVEHEIFGTLTATAKTTMVQNIRPAIQMLTVEGGAVRVTWQSQELTPLHTGKLLIYRETTQANRFEYVGIEDYTQGYFIDNTAQADTRSRCYLITLETTDGKYGNLSDTHTSIHMMINRGMGNDVNLHWTPYVGADILSYTILSGTSPDNLTVLTDISGNAQSFTHKRESDADTYYALAYTLAAEPQNAPAAFAKKSSAQNALEGQSNVVCSNEAYNVTLVESIAISTIENTTTLSAWEPQLHLVATITPVRATLARVAWSILSGSEYATIDTDGTITLTTTETASGTITVQAKAIDGSEVTATINLSFSYVVEQDVAVTGVALNSTSLSLKVGDTHTLIANVLPADATNVDVIWESTNSDVVRVQDGLLTAVSIGHAMITVTTVDGGFTATCEVTVTESGTEVVPVRGITLSETNLSLNVGDKYTLVATVLPENATNKDIRWESTKSTVATVQNGEVTALAAGTATIYAITSQGGYMAKCEITVSSSTPTTVPVTGVTLNHTSLTLQVGKRQGLIATVLPENATNKGMRWTSSQPEVVSVEYGVLTAQAAGNATITVTTIDGGFTATCEVTVEEEQGNPEPEAITVSFLKPADWPAVYLYAWLDAGIQPLGIWPGTELTDPDAQGWYSHTFDESITTINFIFNNGTGIQTADLTTSESVCYEWDGTAAILVDCPEDTGIDNVQTCPAPAAHKVLENGIIYIIRNNKRYTIDGRKVE